MNNYDVECTFDDYKKIKFVCYNDWNYKEDDVFIDLIKYVIIRVEMKLFLFILHGLGWKIDFCVFEFIRINLSNITYKFWSNRSKNIYFACKRDFFGVDKMIGFFGDKIKCVKKDDIAYKFDFENIVRKCIELKNEKYL